MTGVGSGRETGEDEGGRRENDVREKATPTRAERSTFARTTTTARAS